MVAKISSSSFCATLLVCYSLLSHQNVYGFTASSYGHRNGNSMMKMSTENANTRRGFLERVAGTTAAIVVGSTFSSPAYAVGGKKKVDAKLVGYGFPPAVVPDGLVPLCHLYGRGANRSPILVTFSHPFDWVVVVPSNDVNGEDGTVQAGEYATGDTATFFVNTEAGNVQVNVFIYILFFYLALIFD